MMLLRKIFVGNPYSSELTEGTLNIPVSGQFPHKASAVVESGWENITSIENWANYGSLTGRDYKFIRNEIATLAAIKTSMHTQMQMLTANELRVASEWIAVPFQYVMAALGAEFNKYKKIWIDSSKESRAQRWEYTKSEVLFTHLQELDAKAALIEIQQLVFLYIEGIEGTLEDDGVEGILDYILSRAGTSYAATGLSTKPWTTNSGLQMSQVSGLVSEILKDGNYESV